MGKLGKMGRKRVFLNLVKGSNFGEYGLYWK